VEEHLQGFRHEAGFKNFFSRVQPFVFIIEEMQHYAVTDIAGQRCCVSEGRSLKTQKSLVANAMTK